MDIVYLELNNWMSGEDYPKDIVVSELVNTFKLDSEKYCKENKLCVKRGCIDMSANWCITAPRVWVESICPKLLTDEEYTYDTIQGPDAEVISHTEKYSKFVHDCTDDGFAYGRFGWKFLPYCEENIGIMYCDEDGNE